MMLFILNLICNITHLLNLTADSQNRNHQALSVSTKIPEEFQR